LTPASLPTIEERLREFGSSEYAKTVLSHLWGTPPALDLEVEAKLHQCMAELSHRRLIHSARDISDGGIAVALAEGGFENRIGVRANLEKVPDLPVEWDLFGETASQMIITCSKEMVPVIEGIVRTYSGIMVASIGETVADIFELSVDSRVVIREKVSGLRNVWATALSTQLETGLPVRN
jgi:phosphoribosylformylglycinamidine synthase